MTDTFIFIPDGYVSLVDAIEQARRGWFPNEQDKPSAKASAAMRLRHMLCNGDITAVGFGEDGLFRLEPHFWATEDAQRALLTGEVFSIVPLHTASEPSYHLFFAIDELQSAIGSDRKPRRALRDSDRAKIARLIEDPALTRKDCKTRVAERHPELTVTTAAWNKLFREFPRQPGRRKKP